MVRRNDHHHERVNRVLDYISQHLDTELSLARLSKIGCFSPFHFHRMFQASEWHRLDDRYGQPARDSWTHRFAWPC